MDSENDELNAEEDVWYDDDELEVQYCELTPEEVIEHCLGEFRYKDFVIEPRVHDCIRRFLEAGGNWKQAADLLCNNYEAYGQMSNILAEWLVLLGDDVEGLKELFETRLDNFIMHQFDPRKADVIFHQHSDETKIHWLADLISNVSSRQMILDLSERFPDCLLLNFAIRLMADAGYLHEISSKVATSLEQQDIFTRVLCLCVENLLQYSLDSDGYGKALAQIKEVVCRDEHTLLLTLTLMQIMIAREPEYAEMLTMLCGEFRRLCQERMQETADLAVMLHSSCCGSYDVLLLDAMRSMLSKNQLNSNDINVLYDWYVSEDAPSIELLRDPIFMDMVLDELFNFKKELHDELAMRCITLLAIASVASDAEDENGQRRMQIDYDLVEDCEERLVDVRYRLQRISTGTHFIWPDVNCVFNFLAEGGYDAVAAGVYCWVRSVVYSPDFYQVHQENLPIHFVLLDQIVTTKVSFHRRIFEVYKTLFESKSFDCDVPLQLSRQRVLIDRLLYLVSESFLEPVMSFIHDMIEQDTIDLSLIRYFVVECLEFAGPPYSNAFLEYFTPIARHEGIMETLSDRASLLVSQYYDYVEEAFQFSSAPTDE